MAHWYGCVCVLSYCNINIFRNIYIHNNKLPFTRFLKSELAIMNHYFPSCHPSASTAREDSVRLVLYHRLSAFMYLNERETEKMRIV